MRVNAERAASKHILLEGPGNVQVERMKQEHSMACAFHPHPGTGECVSPSAGTDKGLSKL